MARRPSSAERGRTRATGSVHARQAWPHHRAVIGGTRGGPSRGQDAADSGFAHLVVPGHRRCRAAARQHFLGHQSARCASASFGRRPALRPCRTPAAGKPTPLRSRRMPWSSVGQAQDRSHGSPSVRRARVDPVPEAQQAGILIHDLPQGARDLGQGPAQAAQMRDDQHLPWLQRAQQPFQLRLPMAAVMPTRSCATCLQPASCSAWRWVGESCGIRQPAP